MSSDLLLHVGYHKSGSTWLQKHLFPDESAGFCYPWTRAETLEWFVYCDPFDFQPQEAAAHFADGIKQAAGRGLVPVLSFERFSGNPHSGGYDGRMMAERLLETFPAARVLIVIREQIGAIVSAYKQFVAVGGPASIRRYLTPPRTGRGRLPTPRLEFFEYHRLIDYYQRRCGSDRVLVLPFEMLRRDRAAFVGEIARFAGVPGPREAPSVVENVALSGLVVAVKRHLNRILVRDTVNPWALFDIPNFNGAFRVGSRALGRFIPRPVSRWFDRRLAAAASGIAGDRFRDTNRLTSEMTGVDLRRWGYQI